MSKKLTTDQQIFIVECLATFMTPTETAEAVREEFDLKEPIARSTIQEYNPERNKEIAKKWKDLFDECRKRFISEIDNVGIAHQAYRLRELQKLYHQAGANKVLKAALLRQGAEERGGVYTSKRELVLSAKESLAQLLGVTPDQLPTPEK